MNNDMMTFIPLIICIIIIFIVKKKIGTGIKFHTEDSYYYKTTLKKRLKFWAGKRKKDVIVFDTETSGVDAEESSVLSIAALRCSWKNGILIEKSRYSRFYYPKGAVQREAIKKNGLTANEIEKRRANSRYPKYFNRDTKSFLKFCRGTNLFAAYKIDFDASFVPLPKNSRWFCVLRNSAAVFNYGTWMKLEEAAAKCGIKVNNERTHDAMYDTELCLDVLNGILKDSEE